MGVYYGGIPPDPLASFVYRGPQWNQNSPAVKWIGKKGSYTPVKGGPYLSWEDNQASARFRTQPVLLQYCTWFRVWFRYRLSQRNFLLMRSDCDLQVLEKLPVSKEQETHQFVSRYFALEGIYIFTK